jgi:inner membrane protein
MPSPIGHALAGVAFFEGRPGLFLKNKWLDALCFAFLANLPDGDFLPGLIRGHPNLYHHGIFHSLGAALAIAGLSGLFFFLKKQPAWKRSFMVFLVFYSHLLLDFFTWDFAPPYGLPIFWPFSTKYFIAAHPFFINITRSAHSANFFSSLFSRHNLDAALRELVLLGGLALLAAMARWLMDRHSGRRRA